MNNQSGLLFLLPKRVFIPLIFIFGCFQPNQTYAQFIKPADIPDALKLKMDSIFPVVPVPVWQAYRENNTITNFIVTFSYNDKRTWIVFDRNFSFVQIEQQIQFDLLPSGVKKSFKEDFKYLTEKESRIIYTGDSISYYYIHANGSIKSHGYIYSESGNFMDKASADPKKLTYSLFVTFSKPKLIYHPFSASNVFENNIMAGRMIKN